jgi:hypothetical protein
MALAIGKLKGVTPEREAKFKARGLNTAGQFLEAALTAERREELSQATGIHKAVIVELANRADLSRIKDLAGVYGDWLELAGVDTLKELKGRTARMLHTRLLEANAARNLTTNPPTLKTVRRWIALAQRYRKFVQY